MTNRCPICETPMPGNWNEYPAYPFCSPRCKLIDLGRWLSEGYRIPSETSDEDRSGPGDNGSEETE
jgi:endogenous inhibitor of DNA gyrase (YacG/DUF329 family)